MKEYGSPALDCIDKDLKHLSDLFQFTVNYKLFLQYNLNKTIKPHWKKKEMIDVLKETRQRISKTLHMMHYLRSYLVMVIKIILLHLVTRK